MRDTPQLLAYTFVGLLLAGFFSWVLWQMAWADESLWRLAKLGVGLGLATVGAAAVYLLLAPTRRGRRR